MNEGKIKKWETYEDAARQLLGDVREYLGLGKVEGKQKIEGSSGTEWEVDVVAYEKNDEMLVIVECKHRSNRRLTQGEMGGFAYRVNDLRATKGIIVTTIGLQEGAEVVAEAEEIDVIKLDYNSTDKDYLAEIGGKVFGKRTLEATAQPKPEIAIKTIKN